MGIVATAVVLLLAVTQTALLVVLTYVIPPRTCETKINSTDCAEIAADCAEIAEDCAEIAEDCAGIAAEIENNSTYFQVIEVLRIVYSFMTFPEYAVLVYGLYKLLIKTSNAMHKSSNHPSLTPWVYLCELYRVLRGKKTKHYCIAQMGILLAFIIIIIFAVLSLATPIIDIRYECMVNDCCKEQQLYFKLSVAYESIHFLVHLFSPVIVGGMVVTVLVVKAIWFHIDMEDKTKTDDDFDESRLTANEKAAIKEHYKRVTEYKQRIAKIKPLIRVFQTWFVFQWFHYFFQTVTDFTQTIHRWITGTNHPDLVIAFRGVHTAFDVLAFAIPHICGLKLNAYHQEYLRHERKKQLEAAEDTQSELGYVKAYSLTIEKDSGGDFVPRIPGTGIKIPLDNPGYTLGIILTIFALISSFVNFSM